MSYKKIPFATSEQILARMDLSEEALGVIAPKDSPADNIAALFENKLYIDFTNFVAHALPMRESIWWCATVLELRLEHWNELERDTLQHCKNWVLEPEEVKRRLVEQRLAKLGHDCALGWLAQAVFWSGSGSIANTDQPEVMPAPYLFAKAVSGAINTAALKPEWQGYQQYYHQSLLLAENIANGGRGTLGEINKLGEPS